MHVEPLNVNTTTVSSVVLFLPCIDVDCSDTLHTSAIANTTTGSCDKLTKLCPIPWAAILGYMRQCYQCAEPNRATDWHNHAPSMRYGGKIRHH